MDRGYKNRTQTNKQDSHALALVLPTCLVLPSQHAGGRYTALSESERECVQVRAGLGESAAPVLIINMSNQLHCKRYGDLV